MHVFSLAGLVSLLHLSSQHVDYFLSKQWAERAERANIHKSEFGFISKQAYTEP